MYVENKGLFHLEIMEKLWKLGVILPNNGYGNLYEIKEKLGHQACMT